MVKTDLTKTKKTKNLINNNDDPNAVANNWIFRTRLPTIQDAVIYLKNHFLEREGLPVEVESEVQSHSQAILSSESDNVIVSNKAGASGSAKNAQINLSQQSLSQNISQESNQLQNFKRIKKKEPPYEVFTIKALPHDTNLYTIDVPEKKRKPGYYYYWIDFQPTISQRVGSFGNFFYGEAAKKAVKYPLNKENQITPSNKYRQPRPKPPPKEKVRKYGDILSDDDLENTEKKEEEDDSEEDHEIRKKRSPLKKKKMTPKSNEAGEIAKEKMNEELNDSQSLSFISFIETAKENMKTIFDQQKEFSAEEKKFFTSQQKTFEDAIKHFEDRFALFEKNEGKNKHQEERLNSMQDEIKLIKTTQEKILGNQTEIMKDLKSLLSSIKDSSPVQTVVPLDNSEPDKKVVNKALQKPKKLSAEDIALSDVNALWILKNAYEHKINNFDDFMSSVKKGKSRNQHAEDLAERINSIVQKDSKSKFKVKLQGILEALYKDKTQLQYLETLEDLSYWQEKGHPRKEKQPGKDNKKI